ncbi:MAG: arginine--tRNA ligase [Micavibrio sp.]|nr:MAG: arginine--tRNA ligase [Micavibrio sp.]
MTTAETAEKIEKTGSNAAVQDVFLAFQNYLAAELEELGRTENWPACDTSRAVVEPPRDSVHGDMATNAAMVLAGQVKQNPRALGEKITEILGKHPDVTAAEVAGPGFVNFRLKPEIWQDCLKTVLESGTAYGDSDVGRGKRVNVEYVSANPTGPLTAGHARGAVVGDALAALLAKAGYEVIREYYINDAGAQVEKLARSVYLRYREALGEEIGEIPEGHYPGEYLKEVGEALKNRDCTMWTEAEEKDWLPVCKEIALEMMMEEIRRDLQDIGIRHDVFTSEQAIIDAGAVDEAFSILEGRKLIYTGVLEPPKGGQRPDDWEERPQTLFRATEFGDDVDRPLKKSDGSWTYFANDIAYHWDKYKRTQGALINILGADHGGYVKRLSAAVTALTEGKATVDCKLCQMVHMFDGGEPVRMSKRAGTFVTLRDIIDKVGGDVLRFIMLTRKNDQTLEFDFAKVVEQSKENPVFYVQYAHARCCSVLRNAAEMFSGEDLSDAALAEADLSLLDTEEDLALIRLMAGWPRFVRSAAEAAEPHRIAFYLQELAAAFHAFWTKGRGEAQLRFLLDDNKPLTLARLALVRSVALVTASGLAVMGVQPVEEMHA